MKRNPSVREKVRALDEEGVQSAIYAEVAAEAAAVPARQCLNVKGRAKNQTDLTSK